MSHPHLFKVALTTKFGFNCTDNGQRVATEPTKAGKSMNRTASVVDRSSSVGSSAVGSVGSAASSLSRAASSLSSTVSSASSTATRICSTRGVKSRSEIYKISVAQVTR